MYVFCQSCGKKIHKSDPVFADGFKKGTVCPYCNGELVPKKFFKIEDVIPDKETGWKLSLLAKPIVASEKLFSGWMKRAYKTKKVESLVGFIKHLTEDFVHDYFSICHALVAISIASMTVMDNHPQGRLCKQQKEFIAEMMRYVFAAPKNLVARGKRSEKKSKTSPKGRNS